MPPRVKTASIDSEALVRALEGGTQALDANAAAIDAINVFPVPDGDTGTNMSSTMRAAMVAVRHASRRHVQEVADAAARGALMGAKGNSGVILSQIILGFASMPPGHGELDGPGLADAFERARIAAYRVVSEPKEGTILTAIDAAAAGAIASAGDAETRLRAAVDAARDAVARTPELLPVLKEAGVVDAGAQGLAVLLEGMDRGLRGDAPAPAADLGTINSAFLTMSRDLHDGHGRGFCTEFVVEGTGLDAAIIRADLSSMGESLLVVGGPDLVRVHLHTTAPDEALAYGERLGAVSHRKVDNLQRQVDSLAGQHVAATATVAVVAVVPGEGLARLFRSIGASEIVSGGQTMNPSAGDLREAIDRTGAADVIVLPNNGNVIMAARQAAAMKPSPVVHVVPTISVPQGVAALVAVNPDASADDNRAAMEAALRPVHSGEVTLAARTTRIEGRDVAEGSPIAIIDGELALAATSIADAVAGAVGRMIDGREAPLVTLYSGMGEDAATVEALAQRLRTEFSCEVETVEGGQPHYPYLIGVE